LKGEVPRNEGVAGPSSFRSHFSKKRDDSLMSDDPINIPEIPYEENES